MGDTEIIERRIRIGERISSARVEKGYTLRQLAEVSGVSSQNLTKIEHGKYNVSIDILGKICNALDISIELK